MLNSTNRQPASAQREAIQAAEKLFRFAPPLRMDRASGCPSCGARHPVAPVRSRHCAPFAIEHDWRCEVCDHDWTTVATLAAPPIAPGQGNRFAVGDAVRMTIRYGSWPVSSDIFKVLALRPSESGGVQYRIKGVTEVFERIVNEVDLASTAPVGH